MAPEIDNWVKEGEVPPVGTSFEVGTESAASELDRLARKPTILLHYKIKIGSVLSVAGDAASAGKGNLLLEDRLYGVTIAVDRKKDLFKAAFTPSGTPLSPLGGKKTG
jgi:hypothetical protein